MPNLSETLKKLKEVEPVRLIVSSFFLIIVVGTILLMLPISSRGGKMTALVDALFTATSATCVTGLVVFDTWTHWSTFGHVVILELIQVGGLGFVTLATGFNLLLRRKLGLRDLLLARESASGNSMDVSYLIKMILKFTVACEAVGAVILNRIEHPSFPDTLSGVIYQPGAFTAITDGQFNEPVAESAYRAARDALNGTDPSGGAIYYYNPDKTSNQWIRSRPVIKRIGKHLFCS